MAVEREERGEALGGSRRGKRRERWKGSKKRDLKREGRGEADGYLEKETGWKKI